MCGKKKGNRHHTTLGLLNADAKALCLRPDPELVRVFGIPPRRRAVESCPSARPKDAPVAFLILVAARTRTRRGPPGSQKNQAVSGWGSAGVSLQWC